MYIKKLGLAILGISLLILIGTGLYKFFTSILRDASIPVIVRIGITGIILGLIILLVSLIKERMEDIKNDNSEY